MKDPTRGGFASAINEMARKSGVCVRVQEEYIPIRKNVKSAAGMLGIDPLEVANEGKVVMGVPASEADAILSASPFTPLWEGRDNCRERHPGGPCYHGDKNRRRTVY